VHGVSAFPLGLPQNPLRWEERNRLSLRQVHRNAFNFKIFGDWPSLQNKFQNGHDIGPWLYNVILRTAFGIQTTALQTLNNVTDKFFKSERTERIQLKQQNE
jgi:hypothetical protein